MKQQIALFLISVAITFTGTHAEEIEVQPTGEYAKINVRLSNETMEALQKSDIGKRADIIKKITSAPENYAPPVFYLLSSVLLQDGKNDDAMFWFYAGQLRGRIDAMICADVSARDAIGVLNEQFGTPINQMAFKNIPKLENIIEKVLKWEETTPCKYDRRWINLHGMGAFGTNSKAPLSAPTDQWDAIRKKTREEYGSSFHKAMQFLKSKPQ